MTIETKEKQYNKLIDYSNTQGLESLGLMTNQAWTDDPIRFAFTFSRYKFVAKMLNGYNSVLEVGCGDGFASRIVLQSVDNLSLTDFDPLFVKDIKSRMSDRWSFKDVFTHDFINSGSLEKKYDGIYLLDVLEHISQTDENIFLTNIINSLDKNGTLIVGMPSIESQPYASAISKAGHVNCKTMPDFKAVMQQHFHNVFMFSMNDEVVHTGYHKMAHYLLALCCNKK